MHAWPEPFVPELPGNGIALRLFDTVSQEVRPTAPGPTAKIYVCGITPYDATHIGHAATYLAFDLVNRQWRDNGHTVEYAQNITDVDDPLLERATATGVHWQELAHSQIQLFREDMTELRVIPPQYYEGVVDSLPAVVSAIETLIERGAAYQVDDDWYFDVSSDPRFGSVAQLDPDEQLRLFAERGETPTVPASGIRSMPCCGERNAKVSRLGNQPLGRGVPGGTSNASPLPCTTSECHSMSRAAVPT